MSSLWTPDGERPVGRAPEGGGGPARPGAGSGAGSGGGDAPGPEDEEALAEQMAAMRAELVNSPVEVVVANHCYGLFELAAVYLSQQPPLLDQARLAIDALGCLVSGLEGRLGDNESQLIDAVSQLRLAYVQIDGAHRAGSQAASAAGVNGGAAVSEEGGTPGDPPSDTAG